jgi:peptidoglycan/LPS O-acetylase OafA/YrhL
MSSGKNQISLIHFSAVRADCCEMHFVVLDFYRFIMALCIALFHYEIYVWPKAVPEERVFFGFDAAVDFFFILSGFVVCHANHGRLWHPESYFAYLRRRVARIYPLHLATLLAFLLAVGLAGPLGISLNNAERFDLSELPSQLLLIHAWGVSDQLSFNDVSWSISAEFFLYLLFPLILCVVRRLGARASMVALGVVALLLSWATAGPIEPHWLRRTFDFGILRALPSFTLGIILWHVWSRSSLVWSSWGWPIFAASVCVAMMVFQAPRELLLVGFAVTILLTASVEAHKVMGGRLGSAMRMLGDISFGVYMLHPLVGLIAFKAVDSRVDLLAEMPVLVAILALCLTLGLAIASYYCFEQPARRWIVAFQLGGAISRSHWFDKMKLVTLRDPAGKTS